MIIVSFAYRIERKTALSKFIKKKELISDGGVQLTTNIIDVVVITSCIVISLILIYFGIMAFRVGLR